MNTNQTLETNLVPAHYAHLQAEGFTPEQIYSLECDHGIESLTLGQALRQNFKVWDEENAKWASSSGLKFPFTKTFAQVRCDELIERKGKKVKYITPLKAKSEAMLPKGCRVITEGAKDAYAGSMHGSIPTGALAGVSHTRKALAEGCGLTILFDSDGWHNPQVVYNLISSACYCNGKIQLVPEIEGEPKGGLCEYFKAGHSADDYAELIAGAMRPEKFLWEWMQRWKDYSPSLRADCVQTTVRLGEWLAA